MANHTVTFIYYTGIPGPVFSDTTATLEGSWDNNGVYSQTWSEVNMSRETAEDGCVCFRATIQLDDNLAGQTYQWGVRFHGVTGTTWAIPTEIKSTASRAQYREFQFNGADQVVRYHLTHCRYLGANKFRKQDNTWGGCFRVWAPHAKAVELAFGSIWNIDDATQTPIGPNTSLSRDKIAGGYIANDGSGIHPAMPLIALSQSASDAGVWETSPQQNELLDFATLDHRPYMFRITREDDSVVFRTDLYSRCQIGFGSFDPQGQPYAGLLSNLDGGVSCSVVVDPDRVVKHFEEPGWPEQEFIPVDQFWQNEYTDKPVPRRIEDLIIYELHLGALGFGSDNPGTLKDAIALLDYLETLNVNAIELLPLSEFAGGAENWGYATSHYFAIEYGGGGRDQFKHFIRQCHQRGFAVIMDVVYNHYDHQAERAERNYDSPLPEHDIYYWYEGNASDYQYLQNQGWGDNWYRGGYVDNQSTGDTPAYYEEMVRKMFISSAVALMQEFHVDGFRVDQTTSIHEYNKVRATGESLADANIFGAKMLRELGRTLRLIRPDIILMAEDHSDWAEVTLPVEQNGMGFDARWFSDYYHHLAGDTNSGDKAKLLRNAAMNGAAEPLHMDWFTGALWASQFNKIVYNESHDEAGNSTGPYLDDTWQDGDEQSKRYTSLRTISLAVNNAPLIGDTRKYAEARCRFSWAVTALSAGTPMFLFGEEVGTDKRFKYASVLEDKIDLLGLKANSGQNLYHFYSDMNSLRRHHTGLRSHNIDILHVHNENRVIIFKRWDDQESFLVMASLADRPYVSGYDVHHDHIEHGAWTEVFNSDSAYYGGDNIGNGSSSLYSDNGVMSAVLPFSGVVVFAHERNFHA